MGPNIADLTLYIVVFNGVISIRVRVVFGYYCLVKKSLFRSQEIVIKIGRGTEIFLAK